MQRSYKTEVFIVISLYEILHYYKDSYIIIPWIFIYESVYNEGFGKTYSYIYG